MKDTDNILPFNEWFLKNGKLYDGIAKNDANQISAEEQIKKNIKSKELLEEMDAMSKVFGHNIYTNNTKAKVAANEYLFREEFTKRVLSNILVKLIDESLLLDTTQYSQLNPNYKTEIKSRVDKLLESDNINLDIKNKNTKIIMGAINAEMPVNYDVYSLKEDADITDISNKLMSQSDVNKALSELNVDVREKVADIIIKDTTNSANDDAFNQELNNTIDAINSTHEDPLQSAQEQPIPVENSIVEEVYCKGVIESITLNEAKIMIESTGTYNSDLALANALKFVTILEAFNACDLMNINNDTYNAIINKSTVKQMPTISTYMVNSTPIVENAKPINENSLPDNFKSFAQWYNEKKSSGEIKTEIINEDLTGKYTDKNGKVYTEYQLKEWLEINGGYNFYYDNFAEAAKVNGFKKN